MSPGTPAPAQDAFVPLDQVNRPPEGVVLPPKDLRGMLCFDPVSPLFALEANLRAAIVEKTAGYVARNGQVFEREF